jgi:hypothetical protein
LQEVKMRRNKRYIISFMILVILITILKNIIV